MTTSGDSVYTSDETFDMLCSACNEQNKNVEAYKYCVDCQDYYCAECLKLHKTFPALRGHKLLNKEAGQKRKLLMVPTERCDRHDYKTVDMYCQNHHEIGCGTCMSVVHRICQNVFYIPEYVRTRGNNVPEFLQRITNTETKLESLLEIFKGEGISLQANKLEEIENIKAFTNRLAERIKDAEKDAVSDVEDIYKELDGNLKKEIEKLQKELENIRSTRACIESTLQNKSQAFVTKVIGEKCALAAEKTSTEVETIKLRKRFKFIPAPQNKSLISRKLCLGTTSSHWV